MCPHAVRLPLLVALVLSSWPGVPAAAPRTAALTGESCESLSIPVDVPAENVEPYLPEGFSPAPTAVAGEAEVVVNTIRCTHARAGRTSGPGTMASIAIGIEPPNDVPGPHLYAVWTVTDSEAMRAFFERAGVTVDLVDSIELTRRDGGPASIVEARFDAPAGAFEAHAGAPEAVTGSLEAGASSGTLWHVGPRGAVALEWLESFAPPTTATPMHALATTSGGDLETMTGAPAHPVRAFVLTDYEVRFRIRAPAPQS
jgi:hypothetical protein